MHTFGISVAKENPQQSSDRLLLFSFLCRFDEVNCNICTQVTISCSCLVCLFAFLNKHLLSLGTIQGVDADVPLQQPRKRTARKARSSEMASYKQHLMQKNCEVIHFWISAALNVTGYETIALTSLFLNVRSPRQPPCLVHGLSWWEWEHTYGVVALKTVTHRDNAGWNAENWNCNCKASAWFNSTWIPS